LPGIETCSKWAVPRPSKPELEKHPTSTVYPRGFLKGFLLGVSRKQATVPLTLVNQGSGKEVLTEVV
jgi:hypothetical protein